jgi:hypothetical protein
LLIPHHKSTISSIKSLSFTKLSAAHAGHEPAIVAELAIEVDEKGKAHVHNPGLGLRYQARSSLVSWGLFGLAVGVLIGLVNKGGILGGLEHGIALLIGWGIFGLFAGALYGLWVGRGISGRRLGIVAPLLPPDTSLLVAWGMLCPASRRSVTCQRQRARGLSWVSGL